ncbi:MAG: hypothetical protein JWM74_2310, partial [Myxococcaceae bacterium]|nr:hypothetical protein [Myxococcaceae bacterium]
MTTRKAPRSKAHYAKLAGSFPKRLDAAFRKIKNPYGSFSFEHGALHLNAILKKLAPTPAERVGTFVTAMLAPDDMFSDEGQLADTLTAMDVSLDSADMTFLLAQKRFGESPYALTKL